ncbi:uncharacterized protein LOC144577933 [Callithrix jacchus]
MASPDPSSPLPYTQGPLLEALRQGQPPTHVQEEEAGKAQPTPPPHSVPREPQASLALIPPGRGPRAPSPLGGSGSPQAQVAQKPREVPAAARRQNRKRRARAASPRRQDSEERRGARDPAPKLPSARRPIPTPTPPPGPPRFPYPPTAPQPASRPEPHPGPRPAPSAAPQDARPPRPGPPAPEDPAPGSGLFGHRPRPPGLTFGGAAGHEQTGGPAREALGRHGAGSALGLRMRAPGRTRVTCRGGRGRGGAGRGSGGAGRLRVRPRSGRLRAPHRSWAVPGRAHFGSGGFCIRAWRGRWVGSRGSSRAGCAAGVICRLAWRLSGGGLLAWGGVAGVCGARRRRRGAKVSAEANLLLPGSSDSPASASGVAGTTARRHQKHRLRDSTDADMQASCSIHVRLTPGPLQMLSFLM